VAPTGDATPVIVNADMAAAWDGPEGDHWTEQAAHYERTTQPHRERLLAAGLIGDGDVVLDVGCGTGSLTRAAALRAFAGSALGVDLSRRMLDLARQLTEAEAITNATYEQADAEVRPFVGGSVDVVVSSFGAMFFGDPVRAFTNLAGALRPGGRVGLLAWREMARNDWLSTLRGALAAGRKLPVPPTGAPGPFGLADADQVRGLLADVGLVDVELEPVDEPMELGGDADDAYEYVAGMGFTRGLTADLDAATSSAALDSLRAAMVRAQTDGVVRFDSSAWLITARRA
jgi:SAM-dependent methyltransferase